MAIPDQNIYPEATGEAAKIVAKHQSPDELVFYSGWFCPFVQRVWIALEEREIPYHYKEVNPYKREPEYLAINPKALVPSIVHHGLPLSESLIILEYLEDAYPDHKPHLLEPSSPNSAYTRAQIRIWIDFISKSVLPPWFRIIQSQDVSKQNEAREELYVALRTLASKRKNGGPWFGGNDFTIVDAAIAPWVVRDYVITEHRGYKREEVSPEWKQWADALEKRPSVVNTTSLREHSVEIYGRYLRDEAQSQAAIAIRAGKAIP